jgi:hypothetical protein
VIDPSELVIRYSAQRTDTATNGGRMSPNAVASNVSRNFLRDWTLAEVAAGATQFRKFFLHVANPDRLPLTQAGLHLLGPSSAADRVTLFAGAVWETAANLPATPTEYGASLLQAPAAAGATTLAVVLEDASEAIFRTGDQIYVGNADAGEYHDNVAVTVAGGVATLTLAAGDMLSREYPAGTGIASVLPFGDIAAVATVPTVISSGGAVDAARILPDAIGGIDQTVTLTFTSTTGFSAVSDVLGNLGAGSITADFSPINADFGHPLFTVQAAAWSGAFAAGNVVTVVTEAAAKAFWIKGVLPAGAAASGTDAFALKAIGGSN